MHVGDKGFRRFKRELFIKKINVVIKIQFVCDE
jgi:hypothetical protein